MTRNSRDQDQIFTVKVPHDGGRRSSIGSQLPEDFFEYLDEKESGRSDRLLTRFGKRLFGHFMSRRKELRANRSNITLFDSEVDSSFSIRSVPKRASSLLSINTFRRNRHTSELDSPSKQADLSTKKLHMRNPKVSAGLVDSNADDSDFLERDRLGIIIIELAKEEDGFGFNIVGGTDDHHIPGDPGIFISRIREDSAASRDNRLKEGDRIISVNGVSLASRTHDEAVRILRSIQGVAVFMVEQEGEMRALNKPTDLLGVSSSNESSSSSKSESITRRLPQRLFGTSLSVTNPNVSVTVSGLVDMENKEKSVESLSGAAVSGYAPSGHTNTAPEDSQGTSDREETERMSSSVSTASPFTPVRTARDDVDMSPKISKEQLTAGGEVVSHASEQEDVATNEDHYTSEEDDRASTASYDARSFLDDVPRTPKKPYRLFDLSNPSIFSEIIVVSAGVAALGIGIYLGFQFLKRR